MKSQKSFQDKLLSLKFLSLVADTEWPCQTEILSVKKYICIMTYQGITYRIPSKTIGNTVLGMVGIYMTYYHIFTIKYILFTYVIQATISFTYQDCIY